MLFSVIVPIYKVEKYLKRCVLSVLSQSCGDFELILVDDGSPDNCPGICDDFANQDVRVRVVHKENGGLVSARQAGLRIAQGEYVFCLDGDDALMDGALETAAKCIADTDADMVCFAHQIYRNGVYGPTVRDLAAPGLYDKARLEKEVFPKLLSDENMKNLHYFVWGKAIRRTLAQKHQLRIPTQVSLGEDISCVMPCYIEAQRVCFSDTPVYYYTIRDDSLSTDFKVSQITQLANVSAYLQSDGVPKMPDFEAQHERYCCFMCFAILAAAAQGGHKGRLGEITDLIHSTGLQTILRRARFARISPKSRIAIALMQKNRYGAAYAFLRVCHHLKSILK